MIIKYSNCTPKQLIMKLPLLFIALLVQTTFSDQINGDQIDGKHLRANRHLHSVSSSSEETSSGTSLDTSAETLESSSLESHSTKHGHHGGHSHSGHSHSHSWKNSKKGSQKGSQHKGKKGWGKKQSKREHRHWDTSSSSSSSSSSADTAVEAVKLELIDAEPELVAMEPTEEVEVVSTKTSFSKAAESLASVLAGSTMQKPQMERTEINHGN
jgi:hypothetical protein